MSYDRNDEDIESILHRIKSEGRAERRRRTLVAHSKIYAIALVCFLVGGGSYLFVARLHVKPATLRVGASVGGTDVCDKPVLKLANDERVLLGEGQNNYSIDTGDNVNITTDSNNTVKYSIGPGTDQTDEDPKWDQVIIPKKGFVRLELADGTTVRINSASKLEFPRFFKGDERIVKLTGEAFFEVEHDPTKPFIVEADGMAIAVLGTRFNVCAYAGESNREATLVEGSITVSTHDDIFATLRPGQQAFITEEGALATRKVDVALYTSWLQGKFVFTNERLEDICRQVARWYDTDIIFEREDLKNVRFTGVMLKDEPITSLIGMLEKTSTVKLRPNETGYIIMKK